MDKITVDPKKVIRIKPLYFIWGVLVKNEKHGKRLLLFGNIATVCGILGFIGLIALLSYYNLK